MADAKKCDRCGIFYEHTNTNDVPAYKGMKIRKVTIGGESFEMEFDLCPSCAKATWSFLFSKKEPEDI